MARAKRTVKRRRDPDRGFGALKFFGQAIVLLVTLGASAATFYQMGLSLYSLILMGVVLLLGLSLTFNIVHWIGAISRRNDAKHIVFLSPSSGDEPFYNSMLTSLVRCAALAVRKNLAIVPSLPTESFQSLSIWSLFSSLQDRKFDVDGIVFIPDRPDDHFEELSSFVEEHEDLPLVLVDVYFDPDQYDDRSKARMPSFAGGDEVMGGKVAANIAISHLRGGNVPADEAIKVIIINGADTGWEKQRATAFRQEFLSGYPQTHFIETEHINYSRTRANRAAYEALRLNASGGSIDVTAIFACNDDMAIGARAAVIALKKEGYSFARTPAIVGYDGLTEMKEYIDLNDPYLIGTVDVLISEQSANAISVLIDLLQGQKGPIVRLVTPRPYT